MCWTCVLSALTFPRRGNRNRFSPLRRALSVKFSYPYFIFVGLNATYLKRKLIEIQRQTLRNTALAIGTKMAVHAFSVIFTAHFDKQLLHASPYKPFLCKRFRTLPETEINHFNDFTNSFRTTINFTLELSSKQIVFLDTEVFKGPRFIQTHFETS